MTDKEFRMKKIVPVLISAAIVSGLVYPGAPCTAAQTVQGEAADTDKASTSASDEADDSFTSEKTGSSFDMISGWSKEELAKESAITEIKFSADDGSSAYIMFGGADLMQSEALKQLDRSLVNINSLKASDIITMLGIPKQSYDTLVLGKNQYIICEYNNDSGDKARVSCIAMENGYLQMFTLYEASDTVDENHRSDLYAFASGLQFAYQREATDTSTQTDTADAAAGDDASAGETAATDVSAQEAPAQESPSGN